jgi:hypothetical protein
MSKTLPYLSLEYTVSMAGDTPVSPFVIAGPRCRLTSYDKDFLNIKTSSTLYYSVASLSKGGQLVPAMSPLLVFAGSRRLRQSIFEVNCEWPDFKKMIHRFHKPS